SGAVPNEKQPPTPQPATRSPFAAGSHFRDLAAGRCTSARAPSSPDESPSSIAASREGLVQPLLSFLSGKTRVAVEPV
ncbi:Unknown protein, partial [Striga hermonthica]